MIAEGRTIHAAEVAGTLFQVKSENWGFYGMVFPAAETPREAATCLIESLGFQGVCPLHGERIEVRRVLKGTIGAMVIEADPYIYHVNRGELL